MYTGPDLYSTYLSSSSVIGERACQEEDEAARIGDTPQVPPRLRHHRWDTLVTYSRQICVGLCIHLFAHQHRWELPK